jgi:glycine cleavage system H protein
LAKVRGFEFPDHLFYLIEQDTWVCMQADGLATAGLTDLGCHISGEFMDFMPKPPGTEVERDRALAMLEMSKTVRSVRAPVSGTIVAINDQVKRRLALLGSDPYGEGWLVRLKPANWEQDIKSLITGTDIASAVERYMDLSLIPEVGDDTRRTS